MKARILRAGWPLAVVLAWLWTWQHLSVEWCTNAQYEFGFGIPFLSAFLFWKRWSGPMAPPRHCAWCALPVAAAWCAMALGELLRWHDPIWRFTGGLLTLGATLLTATWLWLAGGRPLLRRQLFPLAFAWLAMPWPVPVELYATQHLLHFVTGVSTILVNLLGIAALQRGNLIELSRGYVGIDEACSGIQSLQASLMAALFLGEFFRLRLARRCGLVAGGLAVALFANLGRVLGLTLVLNAKGREAALHAHDAVGATATALTFLAILVIAAGFARGGETENAAVSGSHFHGQTGTTLWTGWIVAVVFALIPVLAWRWFASVQIPDSELPRNPRWEISLAKLPAGWDAEPFEPTEHERSMLQFSDWNACRLRSPEGWSAQVIHLFWKPGTSMPDMAFYHTPSMCMPWAGWEQRGEAEQITVSPHGSPIPFVQYRFAQEGAEEMVLQSLASAGKAEYFLVEPGRIGGRFARLAMLWKAPRRQVNEELLVYLPWLGDPSRQLAASRELLEAVLRDAAR